ncbi:MAG: hypothetical protein PHS48_07055 [Bacteroidales bacterium]|nr:hypothetical protein [Bacteroidales bacterium]
MLRFLLLFLLLLSIPDFCFSQSFGSISANDQPDSTMVASEVPSTGNSRLDDLIEGKIELFRSQPESNMPGFRIRIISASGQTARQKTLDARSRFSREFPHIRTYWLYTEPDYKVYVGDYRTKTDAYRDLVSIKRSFPSAFLVSDQIALPPLH